VAKKSKGHGLTAIRGHCMRLLGIASLTVVVVALAGSAIAATPKPAIKKVTPLSGKVGAKVTITGLRFTGVRTVKFGAVKAAFRVASKTRITATVPKKAKTGKISVTTRSGTATSGRSFKVIVPRPPAPPAPVPAAGAGTLTTPTTAVSAGSKGNTLVFTFTAPTGGITNGSVTITVPAGWTPPVTTNAIGCTTASVGTVATSGQTISVSALTLAANATTTITYGATTGGSCAANDGATAPATVGATSFTASQRSTAGGTITDLVAPSITVHAADGSGTLTTAVTSVPAGDTGNVIPFVYTAAAGGISGGSVAITVPAGWSAPVTTNTAGCTSASAGTVATSGRVITVSGLTLAAATTVTIT
jgi:hypothetical protein